MKAIMGQSAAINPDLVLNVQKDGTVLCSNEAGEPLLREWGAEIGGKLPSSVKNLVQKVISQDNPERTEVKIGKKVYLILFYPLPERECVSIYGFDISDLKKFEEKIQESTAEKSNLKLGEIIDTRTVQALMNNFYRLAHIPITLLDLKGNILVSSG